jgi:branched-chain amino acid transport system substrate-binding protein
MKLKGKTFQFSFLFVVSLLLISIPVWSLASDIGLDHQKKLIKPGVFDPYTGPYAQWGKDSTAGIKLAFEMLSNKGGIQKGPLKGYKFEPTYFDDKADPKEAANIAQRIVAGDYFCAVGACNSAVALAALPIFSRAGLSYVISCAASDLITSQGYDNVVKGYPSTKTDGETCAKTVLEFLGAKRIVEFAENTEYGQKLEQAFVEYVKREGKGAEVLKTFNVIVGQDMDFRNQISIAKDLNADCIMLNLAYGEGARVINSMVLEDYKVPVMCASGMDNPKFFELIGEKDFEAYMISYFDRQSKRPMAQKFLKAFRGKYGEKQDVLVSAVAFDQALILIEAIELGGTTRGTLKDYIHDVENLEGALGTMRVTPNGDVEREWSLEVLRCDPQNKTWKRASAE